MAINSDEEYSMRDDMKSVPVRLGALGVATLWFAAPCIANAATQQELETKVQALSDELTALKSELKQAPVTQDNPLSFFGYGELSYSRPSDNTADTIADVGRFVLGVGYRFDDRTRFVSELEIEHTVSSADDAGEVEVEQSYIEHRLGEATFLKAGLFLIPSGLLNENHEPTRYYGVFRNAVESAIIPTTWREGGVAVQGNTESGLRWDVGVTTGFDLSKWDFSPESEAPESPLGSIHQELSEAKARDLSYFAALNYSGVPGLRIGTSIFNGGASQGQAGFDGAHVTLWEGHTRWTPGAFDLSALYAQGHISGTYNINLINVGNPTLIPETFKGWYVQGAYRALDQGRYTLAPFARYERLNTAASYATLPVGLTPNVSPDQKITTVGMNVGFAPGVVFKADYQWFKNSDSSNRFNLGLGYQF
jgi:hypothetical protein